MKSKLLTAAFLCLFSSICFSQFNLDVSSGFVHRSNQSVVLSDNGIYVSASPSIALKNKFRLRTTVQYRVIIDEFKMDIGSIDLSPAVEYDFFEFLTVGGGVYYGWSLNSLESLGLKPSIDLGPVGFLKVRLKNTVATIRYSKPILDKYNDSTDRNQIFEKSNFINGVLQIGLGYTFVKE